MTATADSSPLVQQVLAGKNRQLQLLAAQGILPLPQDELLGVQVQLANSEDAEVAELAQRSLAQVDPLTVQPFLTQEASLVVVEWFLLNASAPTVLEGLLQRRDLTAELACKAARQLTPDLQEILLLRQDLIVEHPEVLEALEENPQISTYSTRRIAEYRRHLVLPAVAPAEPDAEAGEAAVEHQELADEEDWGVEGEDWEYEDYEEGEEPSEDDPLADPELVKAMQEAREQVEPEGERDQATDLTESQIRSLAPPLRTKLAIGANRSLRSILIRDPNPTVAKVVLSASAITESEIEQVSGSRSVCEEVLAAIANNREWMRKYTIMHNLVRNPRTPIAVSVRSIPRLSVRDLAMVAKDRNVSDAVRTTARRLLHAKRK